MRRIGFSTRSSLPTLSLHLHGFVDYALAILTAASPYLFGFSNVQAARNLLLVIAAGVVVYSLLTEYMTALLRWLPFGLHRLLDIIAGALIAGGPELFGYQDRLNTEQLLLHYGLGALFVAAGVFTRTLTAGEIGDEVQRLGEELEREDASQAETRLRLRTGR